VDEPLESPLVFRGIGTEYEAHHRVVEEGLTEDVDHLGYIIPDEPEDGAEHARRAVQLLQQS
jgi:hypothetical protein